VGGLLDQQPRLRALAAPEQVRAAVLGDDGGVLEGGDGLGEAGDDRRAVAALVPGAQRDDGVSAWGVQRAGDEVGLAAEARVKAPGDVAGAGLV
jgi:hypothetical protein